MFVNLPECLTAVIGIFHLRSLTVFLLFLKFHKIVTLSSLFREEAEKQSNCITYSKQTSTHKFICLIFMDYLLTRNVVGMWN